MEQKKTTEIQFLSTFKDLFNEDLRNIVYYGGRSSGKSYHIALALLLRGKDAKKRILCTREIQNSIKDSVHKLLKDLIEEHQLTEYRVMNDTIINDRSGTEFIFKGLKHNITDIKSTEGVDLCWIEEAEKVTKESLDILTPTIRKEGSQILISFNRFNELDPVYVKYVMGSPANTVAKKVNFDVLEKVGLLTKEIKQEMEEDRIHPSLFAHKWLGEPLGQDDTAILSRSSVLDSMERTVEADGAMIIGVDVARMGNDRTVLWKRKGLKTIEHRIYIKKRTTEICDLIEQFANFEKDVEVRVDDTGVGGGVTDDMIKRGYHVVAINFGGEANNKDKYPNWISEAWFNMADVVNTAQLPKDNDLIMELTSRIWIQDSAGRRRVESKESYKKRGFRSPDLADACIICYADNKKIDPRQDPRRIIF